MAKGQTPVIKVRDGALSIAGFEHEIKTKDGKTFTKVNFAFQHYYKDPKTGEDKHNASVDASELLRAGELFFDAYAEYKKYRATLSKED